MRKINFVIVVFGAFFLTNCAAQTKEKTTSGNEISVENGSTSSTNSNTLIVDVRTIEEWNQDGHADCTVNYPMDVLASKIEELKKYDEVILVCRSGGRAGAAKSQLESAGLKNVKNLGAWQNVKCK
jgi:phage shock protein E